MGRVPQDSGSPRVPSIEEGTLNGVDEEETLNGADEERTVKGVDGEFFFFSPFLVRLSSDRVI